jgi:predicted amidohydrolase YtcJ
MALNPKFTNLAVNTKADAQSALLNTGYLRIYDGTQPATADTAIGAQVLLAELVLNGTFAPAAVAGVATANAITQDASANATGTASWFRLFQSNGTTAVMDGSVGTADANLILNSVAISAGAAVSVTGFTITESKG